MNQSVDQQMAARVGAKKLANDHVRNPSERMPVCRMKRGECPGESRERNTAIHHWVFLDICGVIKGDELMSDHLRINPKRHYRQTEQDETVRSLKCCTVAERQGASPVRCGGTISFSLSCRSFRHAACGIVGSGSFYIASARSMRASTFSFPSTSSKW